MTKTVEVEYAGVKFAIADGGAQPIFLFGVRKSGSSIMNSMVHAVGDFNNAHYVDVAGRLFEQGQAVRVWQNDPKLGVLLRPGNVYGGFRDAPVGIKNHPLVRSGKKILLVRDPRDALTSEYFSNAYSHSIPKGGDMREQMQSLRDTALQSSIRDYVMKLAPQLKQTLRLYFDFIDLPDMRFYRYEDAIMDKRWFLKDVSEHFGWNLDDGLLGHIMKWADVIPKSEVPTEFVRRVVPGDHRDKLDPDTIRLLDATFSEELKRFGY